MFLNRDQFHLGLLGLLARFAWMYALVDIPHDLACQFSVLPFAGVEHVIGCIECLC